MRLNKCQGSANLHGDIDLPTGGVRKVQISVTHRQRSNIELPVGHKQDSARNRATNGPPYPNNTTGYFPPLKLAESCNGGNTRLRAMV